MADDSRKAFSPKKIIKTGANLLQSIWQVWVATLQVTFAPWRITYDPIAELLQADQFVTNESAPLSGSRISVANELTSSWTQRKLSELSWVGITCALLAGIVSAAFSWRDLDQMFWATKGLWYGSLIMDLTSISLATQQSLALNRICCYSDRWARIRAMLGKPQGSQGIVRPSWTQIYVWQVPIMLLNIGLILFLAGLASEIFAHFDSPMSFDDAKIVDVCEGDDASPSWEA
ncbi:hypothetical protein G7054_g8630 [Neopestalotiopsis clavispora]|nr:hypothetical protein G7054_g8630 [Neopestalotiopsis clavispora]